MSATLERARAVRASGYEAFRVTGWLPEGSLGSARISTRQASGLGATIATLHGENIRPGDVSTALYTNGCLQMSDTPDEYSDHCRAILEAQGRVLTHGLGLGCYLKAILAKPEVAHVDVVEINPDVVALVGQHFTDPRVTFHIGDAFTFEFPKGTTWDVAWHDVWPTKCTDDLAEHARLQRRYGRRVGWQGCWAHESLLAQRRRDAHAWWNR